MVYNKLAALTCRNSEMNINYVGGLYYAPCPYYPSFQQSGPGEWVTLKPSAYTRGITFAVYVTTP